MEQKDAVGKFVETIHTHTHRVEGKPYEDLLGSISDFFKQGAKLMSSVGDYFASRAQELDMKLKLENDHHVVSLQTELLKAKLRADRREHDARSRIPERHPTPQSVKPTGDVGPLDSKTRPVPQNLHKSNKPRRHDKPLPNPVLSPADVPLLEKQEQSEAR